MNIYLKYKEPFGFWLTRHFLPKDNTKKRERPIDNKEFYGTMIIISSALIVLDLVFNVFGK